MSLPRCATHPEETANAGTCGRCGTYMCDACASESRGGRLCQSCGRTVVERSMVPHVPRLAKLMLVSGVLHGLLFGIYLVPTVLLLVGAGGGLSKAAGGEELIASAFFALFGLSTIPAALLQVGAGLELRRSRGRVLSLVACCAAFLAVGAACLFPLSTALLIYAAMVLGDVDVRALFDRVQRAEER